MPVIVAVLRRLRGNVTFVVRSVAGNGGGGAAPAAAAMQPSAVSRQRVFPKQYILRFLTCIYR